MRRPRKNERRIVIDIQTCAGIQCILSCISSAVFIGRAHVLFIHKNASILAASVRSN